jgi:hypothetical protein
VLPMSPQSETSRDGHAPAGDPASLEGSPGTTGMSGVCRWSSLTRGSATAELWRNLVRSGWSLLELLKHLAHVELRWVRWGLLAEQIEKPRGEHTPDRGRWTFAPEDTAESVTAFFPKSTRSRAITESPYWTLFQLWAAVTRPVVSGRRWRGCCFTYFRSMRGVRAPARTLFIGGDGQYGPQWHRVDRRCGRVKAGFHVVGRL